MTQEIKTTLESLGLTCEFKFIPFSASRNKAEKYPSLNYSVTCSRNGKPFLTTDYSMGSGHAPKRPKSGVESAYYARTLDAEYISMVCESGVKHVKGLFSENFRPTKDKILPSIEDVYYSLVMDADVMNYSSFEDWADWAGCFGYDEDSRKGEKIYRACLEIALALRAAIGDEGVKQLQAVYEDY